jgi:ribosome-dependent ATPase
MRSGELAVAIEIPSGFGRDVANLRSPEVAFWVDGAMPFRGETTRGYVTALQQRYAEDLIIERIGPNAASNVYIGGLNIESRFRYNQAFPLFLGGSCFYVFTVAALGILLGTIAATMGRFGLLSIPVLLMMMLLSGAMTPMESMPVWLEYPMKLVSPTPHF